VIDKLQSRFLPRFLASARQRLAAGHAMLEKDNATGAFAECHALAGEAAILGLVEIADAARGAERAAKEWREREDLAARTTCATSLDAVAGLLDALEKQRG
jgi:HPt (histidine-containing phosphotransfer) domain-containing protein